MSVINLDAERGKRDRPDADFVEYDDEGYVMFLYAAEFVFEGRKYAFDLWAYDLGHAEATAAAMRQSLKIVGQTMAVVE